MRFMVELHYVSEHRDDARQYLWEHGLTHHDADVSVGGIWIATDDLVAYALVKADQESQVEKACAPLSAFGDTVIRRVTDAEEL